jgi:HSP20 family protein
LDPILYIYRDKLLIETGRLVNNFETLVIVQNLLQNILEESKMLRRNLYGNGNRYRSLWPSASLWRDMSRLQREMSHLLGGTSAPITSSFPAMNLYAGDEGVILTAELPGVEADDLDISVLGETLTLSGSRNMGEAEEGVKYHRRERSQGEFTRTVELPFNVDSERVDAKFNNGVLRVLLPRVEEEKPRKITVSAAS